MKLKRFFVLSTIVFLVVASAATAVGRYSKDVSGVRDISGGVEAAKSARETGLKLPAPDGRRGSGATSDGVNPVTAAGDRTGLDVLSYTLDISFDFDAQEISGVCGFEAEVRAASLDTVHLDFFDNMVVDAVTLNGAGAGFSHASDRLDIALPSPAGFGETISGEVTYHGSPEFSGFGSFTWSSHQGVPLVSTVSWPWNSPGWWPCHEQLTDKALAEIYLTVPDTLTAVSNGRLVDVADNGDGTATWHWSVGYPIVTYLIMAAATNYAEIHDKYPSISGDSLDIVHYVYPEDEGKAAIDFDDLNEMLACFEDLYGEYPFQGEKFGFAEAPLGGGMEHQTMVTIGSSLITGSHAYRYIFVHELAHMWWGDMIAISSWKDIWMSEGFAVYSEARFAEATGGYEAYLDYMKALDGSFPGTVYDPDQLLNDTVYHKGGWVLHMLRGVLGDQVFDDLLYSYAHDERFRHRSTNTFRFMDLCGEFTGLELGWFFEEWVFTEGRPWYYTDWRAKGDTLTVTVEQLQEDYIFRMPMDILVEFEGGGDTTLSITDSLASQEFVFSIPGVVEKVTLDPEGWVLSRNLGKLEITTEMLPGGAVGEPYLVFLDADGGLIPYTWEVSWGSLPPGLELDEPAGRIMGYPETTGVFSCSLSVEDSAEPPHRDAGAFTIRVDSTGVAPGNPRSFEAGLASPAPNPVNPRASIRFSLPGEPGDGYVRYRLTLYDTAGRVARNLSAGEKAPGEYSVKWNGFTDSGGRAASGVYLVTLEIGARPDARRTFTRRLVVLK